MEWNLLYFYGKICSEKTLVGSVTPPEHCLPHLDPPSVPRTILMVWGQVSTKHQDLIHAGIFAFSLTGTKRDCLVGIESPLFPCARVRIASVSTSTALSLSCWCSCWSKVAREALENLAAPHRASPGLWADVTQLPSRLWEPLLVKDKSVDRSPCVHAAHQEFKSVQKAMLLRAAAPWTEMHLVTPVL